MELQVTITLADRLYGLLEEKLPNLGRRVEKALTKQIGAEVRAQSEISVAVKRADTPAAFEAPKEDPAVEAPAETPAPTLEAALYKLEDCRAAIQNARIRIEGEDYANKTEGYEKYHKPITSFVKQIVMELSGGAAEKLPQLSTELYGAFINEMNGLFVENGELSRAKAPF